MSTVVSNDSHFDNLEVIKKIEKSFTAQIDNYSQQAECSRVANQHLLNVVASNRKFEEQLTPLADCYSSLTYKKQSDALNACLVRAIWYRNLISGGLSVIQRRSKLVDVLYQLKSDNQDGKKSESDSIFKESQN